MRIALVGPTHPFKGGISQHTTALARRLADDGHNVQIVSWLRQYPRRLYPGRQTVDAPELTPFSPTSRSLSWNRPDTWIRTARQLRNVDLVVLVHVTPLQVPAYRTMLSTLQGSSARAIVIAHNVLPHERRLLDEPLVASLLRAADGVIVHSEAEAEVARRLSTTPVFVTRLPPSFPRAFRPRLPLPGEHRRLLFFGLVRPYKGLDIALRALALGPADIRLRVAGEFWGSRESTERLCDELGLTDRVELRSGYIPADEVPELFRDVDALLLPYRTATGSQAVWSGFEFGVPVIATRAGRLAQDITEGVNGFTAEPDDVESLHAAINRFYAPGVPERMRAAVSRVDPEPHWTSYVATVIAASGAVQEEAIHSNGEAGIVHVNAPGGPLLHVAKRAAEQMLWARVAATRSWLKLRGLDLQPSPVPPTDLLRTRTDYEAAVGECRRLHLPLHHDRPKNWDALGAVSTVLSSLGRDIRVLDAGAARYSSVLPWLRLCGVRELVGNNLEFGKTTQHGPVRFEPGDVTSTQYRSGWFDAVTCMSVIEHGVPLEDFAAETARIVRPGGLLVVSTDYDQQPPDTSGLVAYGVPIKIFGPDEIRKFVDLVDQHGFSLWGELALEHAERPVHWKRTGLDYTFIRLSFVRRAD